MKNRIVSLPVAALIVMLTACTTGGTQFTVPEPVPKPYVTRYTAALTDLGDLLQSCPSRRPYRLEEPVIFEIRPIQNCTGEDALPSDFSTVLTTVVSSIGFPIAAKPPISLREQEVAYGQMPKTGPEPDLTIGGCITESEKRFSSEFQFEIDLLFEDREDDGSTGEDSVDGGFSRNKVNEVHSLALDLYLVDKSDLIVESVSARVDVVRFGKSSNYGVFFRGSGIGVRDRLQAAQSGSEALRIAAQQSVLVLLGRYLRVPYWRVLSGSEPDQQLVDRYRAVLESGQAPEDFRLLLFAHGVDLSFDTYTFSEPELQAVAALKQRLGLSAEMEDIDLAMHLWQSIPFSRQGSRLSDLRRQLQSKPPAPQKPSDSLLSMISRLRPGEELLFPIFFDYEQSLLSEPAKKRIDQLVEALKTSGRFKEDWWIELRGHTDERGSPAKNQEISEKRAAGVASYLAQKHKVPTERIASGGFGSAEPLEKNPSTEAQYGRNRRVEILLVTGKRPTAQPAAN